MSSIFVKYQKWFSYGWLFLELFFTNWIIAYNSINISIIEFIRNLSWRILFYCLSSSNLRALLLQLNLLIFKINAESYEHNRQLHSIYLCLIDQAVLSYNLAVAEFCHNWSKIIKRVIRPLVNWLIHIIFVVILLLNTSQISFYGFV